MKRAFKTVSLLLVLAADGGEPLDPRINAILASATTTGVACDFVYTNTRNEGPVVTESYSVADGWRLLAIDGEPASSDELRAYGSEERTRSRAQRSMGRFNLGREIDPVTSTIESTDDQTLTITYTPRSGDAEEDVLMRKIGVRLHGRLTVGSQDFRPRQQTIELTEPVSVAVPPIRVNEYTETRSFVADPTTGALLVASVEWHSRGRMFYVKKIGNSSKSTYSYSNCRTVREEGE